MSELNIAVRTVHYAATLLLFGCSAFFWMVASPAFRTATGARLDEQERFDRWSQRIRNWSAAVALGSGVLWLLIMASNMSGLPFDQAIDSGILGTVLGETLFGRVSMLRFVLALLLIGVLLLDRYSANARGRRMAEACSGLLAAMLLATLACTGHAVAEQGAERFVHLAADALHLLAAGAWVGALPLLVYVLARAVRAGDPSIHGLASEMTRRFSAMGIVAVGCLVLTGSVNSWYLVGGPPHWFGTRYGQLLLLKLALFGAMVVLAAINRQRLLPTVLAASRNPSDGAASRGQLWLCRNAVVETALGLLIVSIVGILGTTTPAVHMH